MELKEPGIKEETIKNISKEELSSQILLPKSEWSRQFKEYVRKKNEENKEIESRETSVLSPESERLKIFEYYLKDLELNEDLIRGKTILDLGCGENAEFAGECEERKLATVYGVDMKLKDGLRRDKENKEKYEGRLIKANFVEFFPVLSEGKKFDYIISNSAVPLIFPHIETEEHLFILKDFFKKILENLGEKGEARIYSIQKASAGADLRGISDGEEKLEIILNLLSQETDIDYELNPVDIGVSGENAEDCDVWLNQLLVIKHKT